MTWTRCSAPGRRTGRSSRSSSVRAAHRTCMSHRSTSARPAAVLTRRRSCQARSPGQWSRSWSPDGKRIAYATAAFPDASSSGWVREDLAAAHSLLFAIALAVMALLIVALGAPLGAFGLATGVMLALAAIPEDQWRL